MEECIVCGIEECEIEGYGYWVTDGTGESYWVCSEECYDEFYAENIAD